MSGDVQPRKRKDKKRRKEDGDPIPIQTHATSFSNNFVNDDVNIHVHKEGGTGGGICAKLVFFILFSALAVLIGLIITEHRGLTDLETADVDSKFSQIFEGWIDSTADDDHEDHDIENSLQDEDVEDDEEHDHSDEDEEHEPHSEEDEEENADEDEDNEEEVDEDEADLDEATYNQGEDEDDQDNEDEEAIGGDEDDEDDVREESDEDKRVRESDEDELEQDDDNEVDDDEENVLDHDVDDEENIESEEKKDDDDTDDDVSEEKTSAEHKDESSIIKEETVAERDLGAEVDRNEKPAASSNMAVKIGVGVAILVVAYVVLVRKWRNAPDDTPYSGGEKEPTPDLSRRNTIVVPPTYQEVEQDIEQDNEDYSDEEISEEEKRKNEAVSAKSRYQELRSTYSRSLTPESDIDDRKIAKYFDDEYEENVYEEEDEEMSEEEEEEEDSVNEGEYDEDEDEELLKRLEAKYWNVKRDNEEGVASGTSWKRINKPQVEESDSDKQSDDLEYEHMDITNSDDFTIRREIDEAQKSVENNPNYALRLFDAILQKFPSSPRSLYGKALALDYLADQKRSNGILEQALKLHLQLLKEKNVPSLLYEMTAERCLNRMRFLGQYSKAVSVHKLVIERYPEVSKHLNDLAITYLTINRIDDARSVLKRVLAKWPNDGVALVHYGFILKTVDNKLEDAVSYFKRGIRTKDKGVIDGRFYFHLGDALARLGRTEEAMTVYEEGTANKVFLSKYQRSLYNVPHLTARPWWRTEDLPYTSAVELLKQNWKKIRDEAVSVLNLKGYFQDESENLKDTGDWKQFELYARGQKNVQNCRKCPFTCSIIDQISGAKSCRRGQTKFSVMHPGTHIWPHCGPTNCRLRIHLGLKVPENTFIRVASETRSWREGETIIFDDSFEHEVWHNGTDFRLVLIVDIWHPELTPSEKRNLSPI